VAKLSGVRVWPLESVGRICSAVWPPFSLVSESRSPKTETEVAETTSIKWLLVGETEDLALTRPFGGQVEQASDAHAAGKSALDRSLHEIGREECERDRLVDLPRAAALGLGDAFSCYFWIRDQLIEPTTPARDGGYQGGAGLGPDGLRISGQQSCKTSRRLRGGALRHRTRMMLSGLGRPRLGFCDEANWMVS
jgi:hypothetical protein